MLSPSSVPRAVANPAPPPPPTLKVSVLDVGQGDAILVQFPNHEVMLIDAGVPAQGKTVVDYLKKQGIQRIDILVATHPHEDHIGGMQAVLAAYPIGKVWDSGYNHGSQVQQRFLQTIKDKQLRFGTPRAGFHEAIGDVSVDVLAPGANLLNNTDSDANNNSLVLRPHVQGCQCAPHGRCAAGRAGDAEDVARLHRAKSGPSRQ